MWPYTPEGLVKGSLRNRVVFPWHSVRRVRFKDGSRATRHEIVISKEMVPCTAPGVGGLRAHDVGRKLVVDVIDGAGMVDHLV